MIIEIEITIIVNNDFTTMTLNTILVLRNDKNSFQNRN